MARDNAEKVQSAFFRIAELASAAQDMQEFYAAVHEIVGELMEARSMFIALYDEERKLISWPYYADEVDPESRPDPNQWFEFGRGDARGVTAYILRTGKPLHLTAARLAELVEQDEVELLGKAAEDWLGVPLRAADERPVGVLAVASYAAGFQYTEQDQELLAFVGQHVGAALSRARAIEETRQRNAELALINSVQSALARELDLQAIYEVVGDKIQEIFDAQGTAIAVVDDSTGLVSFPYLLERGERLHPEPQEVGGGFTRHVLETQEPLLINEDVATEVERLGSYLVAGEKPKSLLFVPLVTGGRANGVISLENFDREHAYDDADQRLLTTLAGSLSAALENARLVHETRQRNAELALINSVQDALAGELELQAIYDAVGDRIRDVFDAEVVDIAMYDEPSGLIHFPYAIERGERSPDEPIELIGFRKHVIESRESLRIDEGLTGVAEQYGNPVLSGEMPKSVLYVPLVISGKATGVISLQSIEREHAFSESDQQLLETLAASLSVALENARLVHETRQRNAELALINTVQEALAGELDLQAIYDVVGDKIQEIFDAQVVDIGMYDHAAGLTRYPYAIERGVRFPDEPTSIMASPTTRELLKTKLPVLINDVPAREREAGEPSPVVQGEPALSVLVAPLISGDEVRGRISLQNLDRTNAFTESDVRLLTTLAGSLSVALENARLVHETRQRNAELALINSVQDALAGELELQAIYDAVGERIRDVFDAQVVDIAIYDEASALLHFAYTIERGELVETEPMPLIGFRKHVMETRQPLVIDEPDPEIFERYGNPRVLSGETTQCGLFVPLIVGGRATGVISLQNIDRTHAFGESDQQLLTTLAGSLSVALENARLVHETRQRNAELALINGVQDAIAGELEPQAIYDAVGDRIHEIFDAQVVSIRTLDETTELMQYPYILERGERLEGEPAPVAGFSKHVLETRESLLLNENLDSEAERYGSMIVAGESTESLLFVPLVTGGKATGLIALENIDREYAFSESDQQLLETLAGSLSVALENARLVHETRQRNAELALINGVQDAIAGELEPQAIYDAVGDRIRDVFDAHTMTIGTVDEATGLMEFPYIIERGERLDAEPAPAAGFSRHVLETREALLIAENIEAEAERYGSTILAGEWPRSALFVPLVAGRKATGVISLQNVDRERAFGESDQQLLTTLAGSLSVALENARLVHETRQRVGELATVNSVGQALSSQLDLDALIELVGEQVRMTFDADIAYVALHDEATGTIEFAYYHESGESRPEAPMVYGEGLTSQILDSREPLLLNRKEQLEGQATIGTPSLSYLGVPIVVGTSAIGVISVQSIEEEGRFGEADSRLLATLAANVGVAIQNARLFTEIDRQKQYFEMLVEVSPAAVVVMDADERVTGWNPAAAALFGYASAEAVGRTIDELVVPDDLVSESREVTIEALGQGRTRRITRRANKDGALLDVEMELVPLRFGQDNVGFYAIYHDITELQRAREEAEAATQAKSAFLATMSHEIRTPMNAVIGMTDLLLGTDLTGEQREFAEVVHSSGDALLHVIDDILDYSKIEAGKLDLEHEPFNLRDCVEGALDIVAPRAWEKELELGCLIDEAAPVGIVGDEARLRQVLLNLLSNAVKFTDRGEVVVLVDAADDRSRLLSRRARRPRHRDRDSSGRAHAALHLLQPGGCLHDAPVRGHRPRPRDLEAARRADGRHHRRRERTAEGIDLPDHAAGGRGRGSGEGRDRRRARSPHRQADPDRRRQRDEPRDRDAARALVGDGAGRDRAAGRRARADRARRALRRRRARHDDAGDRRDHPGPRDPATPQRDRASPAAADVARPAATAAGRGRVLGADVEAAQGVAALQHARAAVDERQRRRSRGGRVRDRRKARAIGAADPPRRGQRDEPEGRAPAARAPRLPRRRRHERARGDRGARAAAVRRRADGRPDARARRPRRDAPDRRALAGREPAAHRRDDGERASRGSRGVLRGRDERLRGEADPARGAGRGAQAGEAARERRRRLG